MLRDNKMKKIIGILICMLFFGMNIFTSSGTQIQLNSYRTLNNDGTLSGYVNDTSGNPIEGALVRVHFHETYEEAYSDEDGYFYVDNIPICYCYKNATCSKDGYKTEWILLAIYENTTHNFILTTTNQPPNKPEINGKWINHPFEIECYFIATDLDRDDVRYYINWGDGIIDITDFHRNGEEVTVSHNYAEKGTITITAYAEDIHGTIGPKSTYYPGWSRNKAINIHNYLFRFFNGFPLLEKLKLFLINQS